MAISDCIAAALGRGAISKDEAAMLNERATHYAPTDKEGFSQGLRDEALERIRVSRLADQAQAGLWNDLMTYVRTVKPDMGKAISALFEHYGEAGFSSVRALQKSYFSDALRGMNDFMHTFRRDFKQQRMNKPMLSDVVRAAFGENVSEPAKALYGAWRGQADRLRGKFNEFGGHIGELSDWGLPQSHSASAIVRSGFEKWSSFIEKRLDWSKIIDENKAMPGPFAASERRELLQRVYDSIITRGDIDRSPSMQRGGLALYSQRAEARFLHFKNADAWLDYNRQFGSGGVYGTLMDHLRGLSSDVGLMHKFGPNPVAMTEWLKQVMGREAARFKTQMPNLFNGKMSDDSFAGRLRRANTDAKLGWRSRLIDGYLSQAMGRGTPASDFARVLDITRDIEGGAKLGSAVVNHVVINPVIMALARRVDGLPVLKTFLEMPKNFTRGIAEREGMILQDGLEHMDDGARAEGAMAKTREVTRWLPRWTAITSGLDAVARASTRSAYTGQMAHYADMAAQSWAELPKATTDTLRGAGIGADMWDRIRAAHDGGMFLNPGDITDTPARIAYSSLLHMRADAYVPQSNWAVGAANRAMLRESPIGHAVLRSMEQFKGGFMATNFLTQMAHLRMMASRNGTISATGHGLLAGLAGVVGGMIILQIKQIIHGKDPLPMDFSLDGAKTWARALLTGGMLGLYGDYLQSDLSSYGHHPLETVFGPTLTGAQDAYSSLRSAMGKGFQPGKQGQPAVSAATVFRNNTPILSTHWALTLAYNRLLLDALQYWQNPNAHSQMRAQERRLLQNSRQGYWWPPGATAPTRAPQFQPGPS